MSALGPRAEVVNLAREAFRIQAEHVARAEGGEASVRRLVSARRRLPRDYVDESSFESLVREAVAARITYVGDYHTNADSQRTFLRIVRAVRPRLDHLAIGVEFIPARHQRDLDRYLAGKLSERTLLDRIRYRRLWPYDVWPHYRPLFEYARDTGLPVLALEAQDAWRRLDVDARERFAAARLARFLLRYPHANLLVQFGQQHVVSGMLPDEVSAVLRGAVASARKLVVSQNLAEVYFRLTARGREDVKVVRVRRSHYCVLGTPPVTEQESYRAWLDQDGLPILPVARIIGRFLGLRVPRDLDGVAPGVHAAAEEALLGLRRAYSNGRRGVSSGSATILRQALAYFARKLVDPHLRKRARRGDAVGESLYRALIRGQLSREELRTWLLADWSEASIILRDVQRRVAA